MMNTRNTLGTGSAGARNSLAVGLLLALAAVTLLAREGWSQERSTVVPFDLVGTLVADDDGRPLAGAWVSMAGSEWGSLTNEDGLFRIPDTEPGRLILVAEQLGYEELEWVGDVSESEPLELRMVAKPVLLEGLRVVVDRFEARRLAAATRVFAYDQQALASASERTVADFVTLRLGAAPFTCYGGRGDPCLFVRGRAVEPVVYIDEARSVGGYDLLGRLAPHEVYMVEIYGQGRQIRVYTAGFMEQAAEQRLQPIALSF